MERKGNVLIDDRRIGEMPATDSEEFLPLLELVRQNPRIDMNDVRGLRYANLYMEQLAHVRQNLVGWLELDSNCNVLEIGAECGTITGLLLDKGCKVTCLEQSMTKSLINANRHKEKSYRIVVNDIFRSEDYERQKFDYILCVDGLSYAGTPGENGAQRLLQELKGMLSEEGQLILAVNNKYGLKYWAGYPEEHTGRYFESIEGYPEAACKEGRNYSKREIMQLLEGAGLENYEFYYPYPCYKFPRAIYSERMLPQVGELSVNHIELIEERVELFDMLKAYDNIIRDGLFDQFTNSYLVIAKENTK